VKDTARLHVDVSNIRDEEEINILSGRERLSSILIYMLPNVNFISSLSSILSAKKLKDKEHRTPIRRTCNFNVCYVRKRHISMLWDVKISQG
jgi:hypothetical protein